MAQGYEIKYNVLYQDNQSAIKLENNVSQLSGKRTRHIIILYLFITDRIWSGEVKINYCPTELLLADFYTKPLQGKQFRIMRDIILNVEEVLSAPFQSYLTPVKPASTMATDSSPQECVERKVIKVRHMGIYKFRTYSDVVMQGQ